MLKFNGTECYDRRNEYFKLLWILTRKFDIEFWQEPGNMSEVNWCIDIKIILRCYKKMKITILNIKGYARVVQKV